MKKKMLTMMVWVLISIMVTACSKSIEQQVAEQLELGQKYLTELNYEEAIVAFRKVIDLEPKYMDAYLGLADAYVGINDDAGALSSLETAYQIISVSYDSEDNLFSSTPGVLDRLVAMYIEYGEADKVSRVIELAEQFAIELEYARQSDYGLYQSDEKKMDSVEKEKSEVSLDDPIVSDVFTYIAKDESDENHCFHIPKINLEGQSYGEINAEIYEQIHNRLSEF